MFALVDRGDGGHQRTLDVLRSDPGPYVLPAAILSELAYLIERRLGQHTMDAVLADLESGAYTLDCGDEDIRRIRELARRYADLRLGVADAAVVACAERNGGRVLSLDARDLRVVEREGRITVLPHA